MTRRTKAEIDHIKRSIFNLCHRYHPMTVRQLFYALTVEGVVDKTEASYKSTVCRLTARMRLDGDLPWHWLADNTRWMRKPDTYGSLSDCLEQAQRAYRRSLWDPNTNDEYVEVWLEKDALAGVLYEGTSEYDVSLMLTRGYPSLTYLHSSAMGIKRELADRPWVQATNLVPILNVVTRVRELVVGWNNSIAEWAMKTKKSLDTKLSLRDQGRR